MIHMPHDLLDPNPTNTVDFIMMKSREYSTKNTWYVEYEVVTGSPEQKEKYSDEVIQIPSIQIPSIQIPSMHCEINESQIQCA